VVAHALLAAALAGCGTDQVAVAGVDLHVDGANPAASDRAAGVRPDQPFRTISGALAKAMPGDTVRIAAGTYREAVQLVRGGSDADHRIHLVADGGDVTVKASDVVTGWAPASDGVWKKTGWRVNSQQVIVDGQTLRQIGVATPFNTRTWNGQPILPPVGSGVGDMTPGSFFYDAGSATLYLRLADGGDPGGHVVEASVRQDALSSGAASFVELRGLRFSHSNNGATGDQRGIVNIEGNSWIVDGCSFTEGDFVGLSLSGSGHQVRNSVASRNGDLGIAINGSDAAHGWAPYAGRPRQDIVLENNETSGNNTRDFLSIYQAGGLKASNSCNGVRITGHVARSNGGPAVWFDLGCTQITVERSILQDNRRGIEFEISGQAVLSGNLVTGSEEHGIYVNASSDVSVVGNTLDGNGFGVVIHGEPREEHPALTGNAVSNNIIAHTRSADLVVYVGGDAQGNTSDYNLYDPGSGGVRLSWTATSRYDITHTDLQAFAAQTGQDGHSLVGDPRWVAPSAGDYRLGAGSPAIGAGRPTSGAAAPDLGAFPAAGAAAARGAVRAAAPGGARR
jgi:hypothetical protein